MCDHTRTQNSKHACKHAGNHVWVHVNMTLQKRATIFVRIRVLIFGKMKIHMNVSMPPREHAETQGTICKHECKTHVKT